MKKMLCVLLLATAVFASSVNLSWQQESGASGTVELMAASTGYKGVLKALVCSVQNACYMYAFSGASTRVSGDFYFSANDLVALDGLDIKSASGEALSLWFSADPGSEFMHKSQYEL